MGCDQLAFLSSLAGALQSEPGTHPLDSLTISMSDQHFCEALEGSFKTATAADSPAMGCSLRAVQVLLSRLHTHWKVSIHSVILKCYFVSISILKIKFQKIFD